MITVRYMCYFEELFDSCRLRLAGATRRHRVKNAEKSSQFDSGHWIAKLIENSPELLSRTAARLGPLYDQPPFVVSNAGNPTSFHHALKD